MTLEKLSFLLHGRLWIQKSSQSVSNCRNPSYQKKVVNGLDAKECHKVRPFVHSVQQGTTILSKTLVKIEDTDRYSKNGSPYMKGYKPKFTSELFKIVAIVSRKPPKYPFNIR